MLTISFRWESRLDLMTWNRSASAESASYRCSFDLWLSRQTKFLELVTILRRSTLHASLAVIIRSCWGRKTTIMSLLKWSPSTKACILALICSSGSIRLYAMIFTLASITLIKVKTSLAHYVFSAILSGSITACLHSIWQISVIVVLVG